MKTRKKRKIQRIVTNLLRQAEIDCPPVNVKKIAQLLEAEVYPKEFEDKDAISGVLARDDQHTIIVVNQTHSDVRQRFTIAHEIGHLMLHNYQDPYIDRTLPSMIRLRDDRSSLGEDSEEIEANAFASELLMPAFMIEESLGKIDFSKIYDYEDLITKLAKEYEVSTQAMTFRLINLGVIEG